ncbi:MAG TPA: nickel pincer cofactor biosynthesis protein LarC, partial [Acidimicrobiaceae bacterium]|nr:nickel pincer cofactor biosynthesis protein LarC [Acidimicrobiaceae bacterium]
LDGLGLPGWQLTVEPVDRAGLAATKAVVTTAEQHHHRRHSDIAGLLAVAELPERVRARAQHVFEALAQAEGRVHGIDPADVHFHEVGALDAIVDVVGVAAALESLGVDVVACGDVAVGTGTVAGAHGVLANPPPAVVRLLEGFDVRGLDVDIELTTPTGAAIVAALAGRSTPVPALTVTASGYGAGSADPPGRPNVTQVVIGTATEPASSTEPAPGTPPGTTSRPLTELATNLDDVSGEVLGHAVESLLDAGALDAWTTPIVMKKGRPAHCLSVLCEPADAAGLTGRMMRLTGTLGVRSTTVQRAAAPRRAVTVDVDGHAVGVKIGPHRAKAEFDDVARAAAALGVPARAVAGRAERAALDGTS